MGIKIQLTRRMIEEHINVIVHEICIPLMLISQIDKKLWTDNPIEYVRMQVNQYNYFNPKCVVKLLLNQICGINHNKKAKVSRYLSKYLIHLSHNLETPFLKDLQAKEAILHLIGNLVDKNRKSLNLQKRFAALF